MDSEIQKYLNYLDSNPQLCAFMATYVALSVFKKVLNTLATNSDLDIDSIEKDVIEK